MIELSGVHKSFGANHVIRGFSMAVSTGGGGSFWPRSSAPAKRAAIRPIAALST